MPFPYVTQALFELRIDYSAEDFGLTAAEWQLVIDSILEEESARVEGAAYADGDWRTDADAPPAVRNAVIALAHNSLSQVKERGLARESLGSGASGSGGTYDYTPQKEVRETVKQDLRDAGFGQHKTAGVDALGRY